MPQHTHRSAGSRKRLLIIDVDARFCLLLKQYLDSYGFDVMAVHDSESALKASTRPGWDAVLLDAMLPGADGVKLLRQLCDATGAPVLMLTSQSEEADRILGLESGADDYLAKTCSLREIAARLRAVLRRTSLASKETCINVETTLEAASLRINLLKRIVEQRGKIIALTPVEFSLLVALVQAQGQTKTREELITKMGAGCHITHWRSIDVHISALRRKLGDDPRMPGIITTVRSVGYAFVASHGTFVP